MIQFQSKCKYKLSSKKLYKDWIKKILFKESKKVGNITFIFVDDDELLKINKEFLNHDFYTDVITFDYTIGNIISGDIFISIQRVKDNAKKFQVVFDNELKRVLSHGILHLLGYKDKSQKDQKKMRGKEEECIIMFGQTYLWNLEEIK